MIGHEVALIEVVVVMMMQIVVLLGLTSRRRRDDRALYGIGVIEHLRLMMIVVELLVRMARGRYLMRVVGGDGGRRGCHRCIA